MIFLFFNAEVPSYFYLLRKSIFFLHTFISYYVFLALETYRFALKYEITGQVLGVRGKCLKCISVPLHWK